MPVRRSKHSTTASRNNKEAGRLKSQPANRCKKDYARIAKAMRGPGATEAQLAEAFGVSEETIAAWQATDKEFAKACQVTPERPDDQVEQALRRRATGYRKIKTTIKVIGGQPVMIQSHEDVPPNVNAAKFWLINQRPDRWKQPKPKRIESAAEDDPFLTFLKSINGKVLRPVDNPPDYNPKPESEGPARPVSDDAPEVPPEDAGA